MEARKGKFVLGTHTYYWQVSIDGVLGFGKTKKEAIKDARARSKKEN